MGVEHGSRGSPRRHPLVRSGTKARRVPCLPTRQLIDV